MRGKAEVERRSDEGTEGAAAGLRNAQARRPCHRSRRGGGRAGASWRGQRRGKGGNEGMGKMRKGVDVIY